MNTLRFMRALALLMTPAFASAAETVVTPGVGTLQAAITAAADGDVLLLQTGTYGTSTGSCGATITVSKSITIRAVSKAANPIIGDNCTSNVTFGIDKSVTVQGVQFDSLLKCVNSASVRLLENTLNSVSNTSAMFDCYSDELVMVGNTVLDGFGNQSRTLGNIFVTDGYFAGNTIVNGYLEMKGANLWVVGNRIDHDNDFRALIDLEATSKASVVGNRLSTPAGLPFDDNSGVWTGIRVRGGDSLIASNIITPEVATITTTPSVRAIWKDLISGSAQVLNNVYYRTDTETGTTAAIDVTGPGLVAGNILVGHKSSSTSTIAAPDAAITNNICFNNDVDCGTADGNLTSDPQFVDTVDFELNPASPGIDAGPVDYQYADLDRTRNDIGAYGGPWELGQYDAQRNSSLIAPYVYPLFDTNSAVYDGKIHVRSLGVARLR